MPGEQPFVTQRLIVVPGGIEHHIDNALHVAISRLESADIHTETARKGGPDLFLVKHLTFNLTALEHVGRKCLQNSLLTKSKAQGFHMAG